MKNTLRQLSLAFATILLCTCTPKNTQSIMAYQDGDKYGYKNIAGEIIVPAQFDWVCESQFGLQKVHKNGQEGIINAAGKYVVPLKYNWLGDFSPEGIITVRNNGLYGFVDVKGKEISPCQYQMTWGFVDGFARVQQKGKWGFINAKGKVVVPIEYDDFEYANWTEGVIGACKDKKWGFIDQYNNTVIPFEYEEVRPFSEGLAMVGKDYFHWGYIDHLNNVVIPFDYDNPYAGDCYAVNFTNGRAVVVKDHKAGCINKKGETIIPFKYYRMRGFYNGYASVVLDSGMDRYENDASHNIITMNHITSFGYVDTTGKEFLLQQDDPTQELTVRKAPRGIPDLSDTLSFQNRIMWSEILEADSIQTFLIGEDSAGNIHHDTIMIANPNKGVYLTHEGQPTKWTLEDLLVTGCTAFKSEPYSYPNLDKLTEVSIAYGLLIGRGNYSEDFMYPEPYRWNAFKEGTIYKIIGSEDLRSSVWDWAMPYYKQTFETLHPFNKQVYKDIVKHLKNYIDTYDEKKMMDYLERDEPHFAQYDPDGKYNKYRKLEAFVDRLILLHKVLSAEDAKTWIDKTADEVATW